MSVVSHLSLEKRAELAYTRGYKFGRGTVPEDKFDAFFEFYLEGLHQLNAQSWLHSSGKDSMQGKVDRYDLPELRPRHAQGHQA